MMLKETVSSSENVLCPYCKHLNFDNESEDYSGETDPCVHLIAEIDPLGEQEANSVDEDDDSCEDEVAWKALEEKGVDHAIAVQQPPPSGEILRIFGFRRAEQ